MSLTFIFFGILTILAISSAVVTISARSPLISALSLVFHFFILAGLYLTLQAQFIAVIQILVYAGAIMVLVVFVIMLLNLSYKSGLRDSLNLRKIIAIMLAFIMTVQFLIIFFGSNVSSSEISNNAAEQSTVQAIGLELFTNYLLPFEAVSILLLAAIVGAVVLSKRNLN